MRLETPLVTNESALPHRESRPSWRLILTLFGAFFVPGQLFNVVGTLFGTSWWDHLAKPAFAPPGWWVFPLVWTVNYLVMSIAVANIWPHRREPQMRVALGLFLTQLVLGFAWIPLVYGFKSIQLGLGLDTISLLLTIGATGLFLWRSRLAALWMLPYILWLLYTTLLKFVVWRLN